ncbi:MAG: S9 family peptidase [Chloroherpetonaceae bacterium]|nr:S9 family peptidase [Chthonomonadaceae bacterium]MDW8208632.1 S9 family peptidase [Chloroherpetonaceae bacterium]
MSRPVILEDFQRIQILCDPNFAPDGTRIAFTGYWIDPEKNRYCSDIRVVPAQGGSLRRFTAGDGSDTTPRWSPDGQQIAFLSDRQKPGWQIYLIPADGGEARALTRLEGEGTIRAVRWSPDGSRLLFLYRQAPAPYREAAVEERRKRNLSAPVRVHTRLQYRRDSAGYVDDEYWQVWIADAHTGEARPLTSGDFHCDAPVFSPDGQTVAFLSQRDPDWDRYPGREDIYTVPVEGGTLTRVPAPPGPKSALTWSPDGAYFAYVGTPDPEDLWGVRNARVYLLPITGGEPRDLTGHTDRCVGYYALSDVQRAGEGDVLRWNASGNALFFPVSVQGSVRLCFTGIGPGSDVIPLTEDGCTVGGFDLAPDGRVAVILGDAVTPQELHLLSAPAAMGSAPAVRSLTAVHRAWREEVQLVEPEALSVPNGEGGQVPAWLLRPPDFRGEERYPLVLSVHGGPHLQYGHVLFHELQWLAAQGFLVAYANPRGSQGYGEAHTQAIRGQWGEADYRDVMALADYLARLPWVDADRMAIAGGSYGGFMVAWVIGHTRRFACAIADRMVANLHSMSGTTDFAWPHGTYFDGNAWENPHPLWQRSPLSCAAQIETPLLILHADGDFRCPVGQAEELFAALRALGKTVEFVRYPQEATHELSRKGPPDLRRDRLQRILQWLRRWLG